MSSTIDTEDGPENLRLAHGAAFRKMQRVARQDANRVLAELREMVESAKRRSPGSDAHSEIAETFEYTVTPVDGGFGIDIDNNFTLSLTYDYDDQIDISELHDDAYPIWTEVAYHEGITVRVDGLTRPLHALLCSIQRIVASAEGA